VIPKHKLNPDFAPRITTILDSTLKNAQKAPKNATFPQCITESKRALQAYPKELKNHVYKQVEKLQIDFLETHAIQTMIVMITTATMESAKRSANLMRSAMGLFNHALLVATFCTPSVFKSQTLGKTVTQRVNILADLWLFVMENVFLFSPFLLIKAWNFILLRLSIRIKAIFVILGMLLLQTMENIDAN